jgi:hypothetical protein
VSSSLCYLLFSTYTNNLTKEKKMDPNDNDIDIHEDNNNTQPTLKRKRSNIDEVDDDEDIVVSGSKKHIKRETQRYSNNNEEDDDDDEVLLAAKFNVQDSERDYDEQELNELGDRVEPFNLKEERDMGRFDETGNFVWTRKDLDEGEESDAWVDGGMEDNEQLDGGDGDEEDDNDDGEDGLIKKSSKKIRKNVVEVPTTIKQQRTQPIEIPQPRTKQDANRSLGRLIMLLQNGETVLDAIRRSSEDKQTMDTLTTLSDDLFGMGLSSIYSDTREQLLIKLQPIVWQYRKITDRATIYGPFSGIEMQEWRNDGFFTVNYVEKVEARSAPSQDLFFEYGWKAGENIESFLFADDDDGEEEDEMQQ